MNHDDILIAYDAQCQHGNTYDDCQICSGAQADFERDTYERWEPIICHHGREMAECSSCDAETEARGGLDKCLNCGGYKYGDQLNSDQVCIKPCRNPNEY